MTSADWGRLLLLALLWGGSFFLTGIAVKSVPVMTLVGLRIGIAALVLWGFVIISGRRIPLDPRVWLAFFIMGFINNVVPFLLIAWGQTGIPAGLASILNATTPLWTVLVTAVFLSDEPPNISKLLGVVLGFGGVVIMIGLDMLHGLGAALLPQLAILGAALSYAFAGTYGRRFSQMHVDPVAAAAGMLTAGAIILLPLVLLHDGMPSAATPASTWLAVTILAVACTAFAYVLYFGILNRAGATNISLVTFLVPVSAILLSAIFLGEHLGLPHLIGFTLIAGGLALIDGRLLRRPGR